jgi:hypothetical protein
MTMASTEELPKTTRDYARPSRSIFSNAPNFRCSAIAALVRSPWRCCPLHSPEGHRYRLRRRAAIGAHADAPRRVHVSACAAWCSVALARLTLASRRLWDSNGSEVALRQS